MIRALVLSSAVLAVAAPALAAPDGAAIYKRCAACHLPTGAGVPGAYPPLGADFAKLASSAPGRRYLILAVLKGVSGPITVAGKPFSGVMPAQSLDDESAAAVLNHVASKVAKASAKPFTVAEVSGIRAASAGLTASAVGKLHASAGGK